MTNEIDVGARRLLNTTGGAYPHPHSLPFDPESPVVQALYELEYTEPALFVRGDTENIRTLRTRVRYLVCLWPDASPNDLAHRIHGLLNNKLFTIEDIRLIINGRSTTDPTRRTNEIPLASLQMVGRLLREGYPMREVSRQTRVSYGTIEAIEKYLGIRSAVKSRQMDTAINAVRDNVSIKKFAKINNLPKTSAQRLLTQARGVLKELGEIQ
jgi:hypothetical protein